MHHKWNLWRLNCAGFWSQSITESPLALFTMMLDPDQVGLSLSSWIKVFEEEWRNSLRIEDRIQASIDRKSPLEVRTFLCVNQGHREKRALWVHIFRLDLLKIMFFESAWRSFVYNTQGLCRMSPPFKVFCCIFICFSLRSYVLLSSVFDSK